MTKEVKTIEPQEGLTRRKLLTNAGKATVGVVAAGGLLGINPSAAFASDVTLKVNGKQIAGAKIEKGRAMAAVRPVAEQLGADISFDGATKTVSITGQAKGAAVAAEKYPEYPWPYKKLDVEAVRKRGYENYRKGGCMYAAGAALVDELKEVVGFPYTDFPTEFFKYGSGGISGWATVCGSLNGAAFVLSMVNKDFSAMNNELFAWYSEFPFPSDKHEAYCAHPDQLTTVSGGPLCHTSISKWANAAGVKISTDEKKDRCAKLSGDVAAKVATMLNAALVDGSYTAAAVSIAEEAAHCDSCHGSKGMYNVLGKQSCVSCHDDHTK